MSSAADSAWGLAKKERANASNSIAWARSDMPRSARNRAAGTSSNAAVVAAGS